MFSLNSEYNKSVHFGEKYFCTNTVCKNRYLFISKKQSVCLETRILVTIYALIVMEEEVYCQL